MSGTIPLHDLVAVMWSSSHYIVSSRSPPVTYSSWEETSYTRLSSTYHTRSGIYWYDSRADTAGLDTDIDQDIRSPHLDSSRPTVLRPRSRSSKYTRFGHWAYFDSRQSARADLAELESFLFVASQETPSFLSVILYTFFSLLSKWLDRELVPRGGVIPRAAKGARHANEGTFVATRPIRSGECFLYQCLIPLSDRV